MTGNAAPTPGVKQQALEPTAVWTPQAFVANGHAAAATLDDRIVFYGGRPDGATAATNIHFEFDGTRWYPGSLAEGRPPGRWQTGIARLGNRLIHFAADPSTKAAETWEWDGTHWAQRFPAHQPPSRRAYAMTSLGDKVLLFGGDAAGKDLDDTWLYDGVDWVEVSAGIRPPAVQSAQLATFDGKAVLFGGVSSGAFREGTWEFDGAAWQEKATPAHPPGRIMFGMTGTPEGVVLFGGGGDGVRFADTWLWDGSRWTEVSPQVSPERRYAHAMATLHGKAYLLGGFDLEGGSKTWRFDGTTWTLVNESIPVRSGRPGIAALGTRVVAFGGGPSVAETWVLDESGWARQQTATSPPGRTHPAMVGLGDKVLMFGGEDAAGPLDDTWMFDGTDWTELAPTTRPPPRSDAALGSLGAGALLFGGRSGSTLLGDTWLWDGSNWVAKPQGSGAPAGRLHPALGELDGKGVLFGGYTASGAVSDTWEWDGARWTQLSPVTHPGPYHSTFAPFRGELVMSSLNGDVWAWGSTGWTRSAVSGELPLDGSGALVTVGDHLISYRDNTSRIDWAGPDGRACQTDLQCRSGFCTDGVCCTSSCKGACEACSASAGAATDGLCTPLAANTPCRASAGLCDAEEVCDGASGACPDDRVQPSGFQCRAASCADERRQYTAGSCDGVRASCPAAEELACAADEACRDGRCAEAPRPDAGLPEVDAPADQGCSCTSDGAAGMLAPLTLLCWGLRLSSGSRRRREV